MKKTFILQFSTTKGNENRRFRAITHLFLSISNPYFTLDSQCLFRIYQCRDILREKFLHSLRPWHRHYLRCNDWQIEISTLSFHHFLLLSENYLMPIENKPNFLKQTTYRPLRCLHRFIFLFLEKKKWDSETKFCCYHHCFGFKCSSWLYIIIRMCVLD